MALSKQLGFWQGLALYLAAVLGTGILVIPALAYQKGGVGSLIAWFILGIIGFFLAWTFAEAGASDPNAGGVQHFISKVMGKKMGGVMSWLILFSVPAGAVAASTVFADHFVVAANVNKEYVPWIAWGSLAAVALLNYFGLKVSANMQLLFSGILVLILLLLIGLALPNVSASNFHPILSKGWKGVAQSSVVMFWSFLGWEAIAHLVEEFKDPKRDLLRSAFTAALIVGVLYFMVAFVLIGTNSMNGDTHTPLTLLISKLAGPLSGRLTAGFASLICFGTLNAYMAGLSRLVYSMSRDRSLPTGLTIRRSILFLLTLYTIASLIRVWFQLSIDYFFLIPNVAFLTLYTLGCISAAKILQRKKAAKVVAYFAAFCCALMIPFGAEVLWYPAILLVASAAYLSRLPIR